MHVKVVTIISLLSTLRVISLLFLEWWYGKKSVLYNISNKLNSKSNIGLASDNCENFI